MEMDSIKYCLVAGIVCSLTNSAEADYLIDQLKIHPSILRLEQTVVRQMRDSQRERATIFPDISARIEATKDTFENNTPNSLTESDNLDLTITGTFDLFEGYDYNDRADQILIEADISSESARVALYALWNRTHKSFITARREAARIKVFKDAENRLSAVIREIEPVIDAGELPESSKYPLEESILNFKLQQNLAKETRLTEVEALVAEFPHITHKKVKAPRKPKGTAKGLTEIAYLDNPQYSVANLSTRLADERRVQVSKNLYPTIQLYAEYRRNLGNADSPFQIGSFETDTAETEIGIRIVLPFPYDPAQNLGYKVAVDEILENQFAADGVALNLRTQIRRYAANIKYLDERLALLKRTRKFHIDGYNTTKEAFKEGTSSALDVSSRISSLSGTENQIVTVTYTLQNLYVDMWTALGRTPHG